MADGGGTKTGTQPYSQEDWRLTLRQLVEGRLEHARERDARVDLPDVLESMLADRSVTGVDGAPAGGS